MTSQMLVDLLIGLLILGFMVFSIILVGYYRAISRRNSFLNEMKTIQKSVRDLQSGIHTLQVNFKQNQILKREPYLSRVKTLDIELSWLEFQFNITKDRYVYVQDSIKLWEKRDKLSQLISFLPGSDFDQLMHTTSVLSLKVIILNKYLLDALARTHEIPELGWEVSYKIREIVEKLENSKIMLQELIQQHVHGNSIDDARNIIVQASQKLLLIPQELLKDSKEEIISQNDYGSICQAYEIYQEVSPVIDNVSLQINHWWDNLQRARQKINITTDALTNAQGLIFGSSEKIALGYLSDNMKTIQSIADILGDTLNRVEIESLLEMIQEADRIYQLVIDTTEVVKRARRNQTILEPLLEQIESGLMQIDEQVSKLSKHSIFPVAWDESSDSLFSINRRMKEIIVKNVLRSPDEIQNHLTIALELYKAVVELSSRIKQTAINHEALVSIYQTEAINQGLYWSQEAKRILDQAEKYDQANFPKNLNIQQLSQNLDDIEKQHQSVLTKIFAAEIRQSMIQSFLDEMRSLRDRYAVMQAQVTEVKSYLNIIREEENQIRQTLQKNQSILNQLTSIVKSSPLLLKQGTEKEINRLKKNLESCFSKLDNISTGTIENKHMRSLALDQRVEMTCNQWMIFIEKNIANLRKTLQQTLEKLDNLVNLDDVVVFHARKLLSEVDNLIKNPETASDKGTVVDNSILHLKAKNDLWHDLMATTNELAETIEKPIVEAHRAALKQKELALKQTLLAADKIPEKRSWPPTSYVMSSLCSDLAVIDSIWEKNASLSMRAILWVRKFGEMSIKYQEFVLFTINAIDTCRYEKLAIAELENHLDAIDQKWSILEHEMADDRMAAASIRAIKKEYKKQYNQIKRRWQFSGSLPGMSPSYEEIKNSLLELAGRFQSAEATINNEQGEAIILSIQ